MNRNTVLLIALGALAVAGPVWAQQSDPGKSEPPASPAPAAATATATSDSTLPMYLSMTEQEKELARWVFYNLDDREVARWKAVGFSDTTIRAVANLSRRTFLPMEFLFDRMKYGGVTLMQLAAGCRVSTHSLDDPIPGMGSSSYPIFHTPPSSSTPSSSTPSSSTPSSSTPSSSTPPSAPPPPATP